MADLSRRPEREEVVVERLLGDDARRYIAERLEDGTRLTRAFAPTIRSGLGTVIAFVPEDLRDTPIGKFDEGLRELGPIVVRDGWAWEKVVTAKEELAERVYAFVRGDRLGLFVVAAMDADPDSPYLNQLSFPFKVDGSDVYLMLSHGRTTSKDEVRDVIKRGSSWNFISFLCLGSESALEEAVLGADEVLVRAFDGEGYLVWRRV